MVVCRTVAEMVDVFLILILWLNLNDWRLLIVHIHNYLMYYSNIWGFAKTGALWFLAKQQITHSWKRHCSDLSYPCSSILSLQFLHPLCVYRSRLKWELFREWLVYYFVLQYLLRWKFCSLRSLRTPGIQTIIVLNHGKLCFHLLDIYILYEGETQPCSYFCTVCEHAFTGVLACLFGVLLLALPPSLTLLW